MMKKSEICWIGKVIKNCEDCGKDLSKYRIVEIKTASEYLT